MNWEKFFAGMVFGFLYFYFISRYIKSFKIQCIIYVPLLIAFGFIYNLILHK
jgi:hypothetical protein